MQTTAQLVARTWYGSQAFKDLMAATENGKLMFTWRARLNDGDIVSQFENHTFDLLMQNPDVTVPCQLKISTDVIPRDKVTQYTIFPIARTKRTCPWFNVEGLCFNVFVDPAKEDLIANWLIDHQVIGGYGCGYIVRQVLGVVDRETGKRNLTVVSPSGAVHANLQTEDISYEGE